LRIKNQSSSAKIKLALINMEFVKNVSMISRNFVWKIMIKMNYCVHFVSKFASIKFNMINRGSS
jgi:hypothetical protein